MFWLFRGKQKPDRWSLREEELSAAERSRRASLPEVKPHPRDPSMRMILVQGGDFLAGARYHRSGSRAYPTGTEKNDTFLVRDYPPFYIGETEVTNAQYALFLNSASPSPGQQALFVYVDPSRPGELYQEENLWVADPARADFPVTNVSWFGAKAYCEWAGLRLPQELEWEKAARGTDGRLFPWGDDWDPARCSCQQADPWHAGRRASVWAFPEGRSPYGVMDMVGNVREWCDDGFHPKAYVRYFKKGDYRPQRHGLEMVVRSSANSVDPCSDVSLRYRCSVRKGLKSSHRTPSVGFRPACDG